MRTIQFREAICEAMSEEMRTDETIYLMGEEVAEYNGAYKASKGMLDEFGSKRVIDTPIAELGFAGIAIGSTMTGNRPIVEYMSNLPRMELIHDPEGTLLDIRCEIRANVCRSLAGVGLPGCHQVSLGSY